MYEEKMSNQNYKNSSAGYPTLFKEAGMSWPF